jgi:NTE family protein
MIEYNVRPYQRVSTFQIDYYEQDGLALARPNYAGLSDSFDYSGIRKATPKSFECTAWHIALEDIDAVVPWKVMEGKLQPLELRNEQDQRTFAYRGKLSRVIKQLQTNYKLDGPPNCKAEFLQQSLYDAAHIAVREDKPSVEEVCRWFSTRNLIAPTQCKVSAAALRREPYDVVPLSAQLDMTRTSQQTNRFVQCRP